MVFDKEVFLDNLEYLMKEKNVKAKEIEDKADVSKGYISRLKQENNKSVPGIDFILNVSEFFGVSVETLSVFDLSKSSDNEKYINNFLNHLIIKTEKGDIKWSDFSFEDLSGNKSVRKKEDLFTRNEPSFMQGINKVLNGSKLYRSTFEYGDYSFVRSEGNCFVFSMDEDTYLYLTKVVLEKEEEKFEGFEMFMSINDVDRKNLCCVYPERKETCNELLYRLYNTIKEMKSKNILDDETKQIIDDFLKS